MKSQAQIKIAHLEKNNSSGSDHSASKWFDRANKNVHNGQDVPVGVDGKATQPVPGSCS